MTICTQLGHLIHSYCLSHYPVRAVFVNVQEIMRFLEQISAWTWFWDLIEQLKCAESLTWLLQEHDLPLSVVLEEVFFSCLLISNSAIWWNIRHISIFYFTQAEPSGHFPHIRIFAVVGRLKSFLMNLNVICITQAKNPFLMQMHSSGCLFTFNLLFCF